MGRDVGNDKYIEITTAIARAQGHKIYIHRKTGIKVRLDLQKIDPKSGELIKKHWHIENPNKTGVKDKYYGKDGKLTVYNDKNAHLTEEEMYVVIEIIEGELK